MIINFVELFKGFVGERLVAHKFKNIDALEPSEGMLNQAKAKGFYSNYFMECIHADKPTSLNEGKYND